MAEPNSTITNVLAAAIAITAIGTGVNARSQDSAQADDVLSAQVMLLTPSSDVEQGLLYAGIPNIATGRGNMKLHDQEPGRSDSLSPSPSVGEEVRFVTEAFGRSE